MEEIKFIDSGINSGKFNMAADYYFSREKLESPIFRVYRWKPYCISLGYHQKIDEIDLERLKNYNIDLVRRETGGRAVFHATELTYSMIIPKNSQFYSDSIMDVYNKISKVLVRGLNLTGVSSADLERGEAPNFKNLYKEKLSSVCFSSTSTYEVVSRGKKIVGSAQKRLKDSVLQHGSILVGLDHIDLIDYLSIPERLKSRFKEQVKEKTTTVAQLIDLEKNQYENFYKELSENLYISLEEIFGVKVNRYYFNNSEISEITKNEKYFKLDY
ncbi:MAG: octanoyltransferase [Candidatus Cloacimonadota bacterium]|nr:MAG: octanoyltransferase [Candidatus Cloacimonadota bacterium]PIE78333.1 MAG: octanoyltransferase [Candidatus Delongbacteria bacterium]